MEGNIKKFGDLRLSEVLEKTLGEKAGLLLSEIQHAIQEEKLRGESLKNKIYELFCKYHVNNNDAQHVVLYFQVVTDDGD